MAEYDFHFSAAVMDGIFGEVIDARGAWDTLGERLDNMEQGTGDTYTKAEVDTMLAEKVDKVAGKGLSTNDFTNEDKAQITTNKNGIAAVANRGSKNLIINTQASKTVQGLVFTTQSDGTARVQGEQASGYADYYYCGTFSGTDVKYDFSDGDYILSFQVVDTATGTEINSNYIYCRLYDKSENPSAGAYVRLNSSGEVTFSGKITAMLFTIQPQYGAVGDITVKAMIRPASIEDDTYVPYAPSNRELYEMILALQSGT